MSPEATGDDKLFSASLIAVHLSSLFNVFILFFIPAPYGKHSRPGWGPTIPSAIAWFVMESPTLWLSLILLPAGRHRSNPFALAVLSLYLLHYIHRTLIYPRRLRRSSTSYPLSIAAMAFVFNLLNAYVQTRSASHYADYLGWPWEAGALTAARVAIGSGIFFWGIAVNVRSDLALARLKEKGGGGYKIPRGGWFELVSCPNYMGELAEWAGWAMIAWSPAALGFAVFTASNLVPRACAHHKWYLQKFGEDYPTTRKAILPYVF
ncbi:hypothetical protein HPP92_018606 [Vanilla planifolia]|uniref:Steroid 5-alpha-reductase DET2 n=1 Tax=Vanilla planifolia TaxID=51239 RepID=A0A835QA71_VANPL|nr:hypothetical protein HPP92_018606 [Vanilla planifolia]